MLNVLCVCPRTFFFHYSQIHVHVYDLVEDYLDEIYDYYSTISLNASTINSKEDLVDVRYTPENVNNL